MIITKYEAVNICPREGGAPPSPRHHIISKNNRNYRDKASKKDQDIFKSIYIYISPILL